MPPKKTTSYGNNNSSKSYVKDFLNKMHGAEKCSSTKSDACFEISSLNKRIDNMDFRRNHNKKEVFKSLDSLQARDKCVYCKDVDFARIDLAGYWKRNKLNGL